MVSVEEFVNAAATNKIHTVRQYINEGKDVNASEPGSSTALLLAACNGHYNVGVLLLQNGADPNVRSQSGCSALYLASIYSVDFLKVMLDYGADVNICNSDDGQTALMRVATSNQRIQHTELLLEYGADTSIVSKIGNTALDRARGCCSRKNVEILENWVPKPKYEFISEPIDLVV